MSIDLLNQAQSGTIRLMGKKSEKQVIAQLLKSHGSASAAARAAGVSLRTFLRRTHECGAKVPKPGRPRAKILSSKDRMNQLAAAVALQQARFQPLLPDIDPHDMHLILCSMMRPIEERRFLLRRDGDMYVR